MRRQPLKEMFPTTSPDVEACATHAEPMHAMDILGFIDAQKIPSEFFSTPYRLLPAPGGEQLYALLCDELQRRGKIGIAHVELQARPQLAALVPQGRSLMLTTLRWANEAERQMLCVEELLLSADALMATPHACCMTGGVVANAGPQPLLPEMPALAEYAMKDENAEFALEEPDDVADDEDVLEERYLSAAVRREGHPRNGYAMRGSRPRSRRSVAGRSRRPR